MPVMKAILAVAHGAGLPSVRVPTANPVLVRPSVVDKTDAALAITHQLRPHELAPLGPLSGPPTRETAIGCMRFCREWESINEKLLAELRRRTSLPEAPGKLKVLIFERTTQGFTKKHPVVQKLLAMDSVEVLYRSRPRITRPWKLYSSTVDALPSALLIQWADVVVCSVSSIALDVLYYQKPLLYAKFLAPAQTATYENFGAAWTLRSEAELLGAIEQIRGARGTLPYAEAQVKEFFHAAVYLGDPHYDVLGGYSRFYRTLAGD